MGSDVGDSTIQLESQYDLSSTSTYRMYMYWYRYVVHCTVHVVLYRYM
eukprot:COSAG03_NODE_8922_length_760_cov_0.830560_1_plen_47_part_10